MANVVVIDDEEALAELYSIQIATLGHTVQHFSDSRAAVEHIKAHRPDVVVTDMRMPHLSGMDICKIVRAEHLAVGLIIVSGYWDTEADLGFGAVDDILKKPFPLRDVSDAVERVLASRQSVKKVG